MRKKWLKVIFLMMLASASCFGGMNPKDIESVLHLMNETKVELSLPDENDRGDDGPNGYRRFIEIEDAEQEDPSATSQ